VGEPRRYRSDDRDLDGHDLELVVLPPDGNGDWYVSIVEHGDKIGPTVRITTSGAPRGQELVCVAVAKLFRAMGGESIEDEAGDDLATFLRLRDGDEGDEIASLRRQLACLASCPVRTVRHHIDSGELEATDSRPARVAADRARAYLSARGVRV
jgi:hypothetical protein